MQELVLPDCPRCESRHVTYKAKAGMWECQECESRFDGAAPQLVLSCNSRFLTGKTTNPKAIFFSYGHDANKELVDQFKTDLEKRGHTVWIDYKEIGTWSDWKGKITDGIHDSDLAVAFLSKHATRDPGVCRNEVAMALNRFGTIYPILLEPVQNVTPPVTISHLQWQDLSQWEDIRDGKIEGKDWARWYEEKLIQIITLLEGEASEFQGDINSLREVLKPVSFTSDIARQIPEFTGREWVFEAYRNWLENQKQSRLFWIKAGPGVGKTAIAAMLAHSYQSAVVGAWFCQANSIERRDTHKALCSIAFQLATRWDDYRRKLRFQLGFNPSIKPDDWQGLRETLLKKNEADLFNFLLAEPLNGLIWREQRLVIVIDALDEASDVNGQNPLIDLLVTRLANLPSWLNFVVTSRPNPEVVTKLQGFAPFELDTEDHRNITDLESYLAAGFAKNLDFIALNNSEQNRIKSILINNSQGMILYLQQILKGLEEGALNLNTIENIPRGLGSLYRIAFDHQYGGDKLQIVYDAEVKPLLRLLLAAPELLPPALAQQVLGWDKERYLRRRNRLGAYVLETHLGCKLFHKTLYEWLSDESSSPYYIDSQLGKREIAELLWEYFDNTEDKFKLEWPNQTLHWLPNLLPTLPQWGDSEALDQLGNYLITFAQYNKADELLRRALVIREKQLSPDHPDVATSLTSLACLLNAKGDYDNAEPLFRRALAILEKALGSEHPKTAECINNLAVLLHAQGNYDGAEPLYRRALGILESNLGAEHVDTAVGLSTLANLLEARGDNDGAESLYRRALYIREKALGAEHPDTASSLNNLANLLRAKGDYFGAKPFYLRALSIREHVLGAEHPLTAMSQDNLGGLLHAMGEYDGAESFHRNGLVIREKTLGYDHPSTATSFYNLANLLRAKGIYEGAEPLYRSALAIWESVFGADHPKTAAIFNNQAILFQAKGSYCNAEALYLRTLAIWEKLLGPEHPDTGSVLDNLAGLYLVKGDYEQAEAFSRRALAIREKSLGLMHPKIATSLSHLANILLARGQYDSADSLCRRALTIREKSLPAEHPKMASILSILAKIFQAKGDYECAEPLFFRALEIQEKTLIATHPNTANTLNHLALLLRATGDFGHGEQLCRAALVMREQVLGLDHPDTANSLQNLSCFLSVKGELVAAEQMHQRALAIYEKALGVEHPETIRMSNITFSLQDQTIKS